MKRLLAAVGLALLVHGMVFLADFDFTRGGNKLQFALAGHRISAATHKQQHGDNEAVSNSSTHLVSLLHIKVRSMSYFK